MAWEERVELMFECHDYSKWRKLKLTRSAFVDYAINWWDCPTKSRWGLVMDILKPGIS